MLLQRFQQQSNRYPSTITLAAGLGWAIAAAVDCDGSANAGWRRGSVGAAVQVEDVGCWSGGWGGVWVQCWRLRTGRTKRAMEGAG